MYLRYTFYRCLSIDAGVDRGVVVRSTVLPPLPVSSCVRKRNSCTGNLSRDSENEYGSTGPVSVYQYQSTFPQPPYISNRPTVL